MSKPAVTTVKVSVFLKPSVHKRAASRARARNLSLTRYIADLVGQSLEPVKRDSAAA